MVNEKGLIFLLVDSNSSVAHIFTHASEAILSSRKILWYKRKLQNKFMDYFDFMGLENLVRIQLVM